jgi:membrane protein
MTSRDHDETRDASGGTEAHEGGTQQTSSEKAQTAVDPHDDRKPDSPNDIPKPGWMYTARKAFREFMRDQSMDLAAALTYWGVLAIAPTLLVLVSLLGVFGDGQQTVQRVMDFGAQLGLPDDAIATLEPIVQGLADQQGAGLGLIFGLLIALWSASGYVNAFSRAMNRVYEIDEGRPVWKLRPKLLLVTLVMLVLVAVIVAAMVLSGGVAQALGDMIGLGETAVLVWDIAKWPVIVALVALVIAILYYATPNIQQPKFRWMSVGAFTAIVVWALATLGFALYVTQFGGGENYEQTYGALAGVILFLLWVWITNNALLFGAQVDSELERTRELVAGIKAEETLQLPPRDTKASDKKQAQYEEDVERGRELRLSAGSTDGKHTEDGAERTEGDGRDGRQDRDGSPRSARRPWRWCSAPWTLLLDRSTSCYRSRTGSAPGRRQAR